MVSENQGGMVEQKVEQMESTMGFLFFKKGQVWACFSDLIKGGKYMGSLLHKMSHTVVSCCSEKMDLEDREMAELIKAFKKMHISPSTEAKETTACKKKVSRESPSKCPSSIRP